MRNFNRRSALTVGSASLLAPAVMVGVAPSSSASNAMAPGIKDPLSNPLLNLPRAYEEMERAGVDALICTQPQNIFYLTNNYPLLYRMGMSGMSFAILTRNQKIKPQLILGEFIYYYSVADDDIARFVDIRLFTGTANSDAVGLLEQDAFPRSLPKHHASSPMQEKEVKRRAAVAAVTGAVAASAEQALVLALRDLKLTGGTLAIDDMAIASVLEAGDISAKVSNGENLIRSIRLQKTAAELRIQRYAANANAQAALAASKLARDGAMVTEIRAAYANECAKRGLAMDFMVIDRVSSPDFEQELVEGQAFLIDGVSNYLHYHGDYGRTIFIGEPTAKMREATDAMALVWNTVREQLRPGLTYSQVSAIGAEAARKANIEAHIMCNPHSVGMFHTDEPTKSPFMSYDKPELTLMEGMVLSVDVPMIDTGLGGSAHLEDLTLITKDGSEPLNDIGDQVILV